MYQLVNHIAMHLVLTYYLRYLPEKYCMVAYNQVIPRSHVTAYCNLFH